MANLTDITAFLNTFLNLASLPDTSWNGLQVEGGADIEKIGLAVDAGLEVFASAAQENCQLLITHHGLFWDFADPALVGWMKQRVELLQKNNLSLYVAHLPLDLHREVGNNAQLLKILGAVPVKDFFSYHGVTISFIGELSPGLPLNSIASILEDTLHAKLTTLAFGKPQVSRIAVMSGHAGYSTFAEALRHDIDLFIAGDNIEIYQTAKDAGVNVIFAGHYATETLGVRALGEVLKEKFAVDIAFIDKPTGL